MARRNREDVALLRAAAGGDDDAFAEFYRRHVGGVIGFFMNRLSDSELSFDLTAEVFAAVVVAGGRYDRQLGPVSAWLYGIAQNKLLDSLRRGRVQSEARRRLGLEPVVLSDGDLEQIADLGRGAQPALESLAELPREQRDAVRARVLDERSYTDIAGELECSEAVIRQRVHRGLDRLRARMEGEP